MHYWIKSDDAIIDGTAIQFQLSNYERTYTYSELIKITDIQNCDMIYDKNDTNYQHKVDSFIHERLGSFIKTCMKEIDYNFESSINIIRNNIYEQIIEDFRHMTFSSLCKNNMSYYGLSYDKFVDKCLLQNIASPKQYQFKLRLYFIRLNILEGCQWFY